MTLAIALASFASSSLTAMGGRVVWPRETQEQTTKRVAALEDSMHRLSLRIDTLTVRQAQATYYGCATLNLVQPKAIPPKECKEPQSR